VGFLADGTTTRDEVLLRLGRPSFVDVRDGVLAYRIREPAPGVRLVEEPVAWPAVVGEISLVLVFDEAGVLRRHALVVLHPRKGG
jgi:outer membrane protein assembly factor BamE (lipoprotein component of BamABCDE complex)